MASQNPAGFFVNGTEGLRQGQGKEHVVPHPRPEGNVPTAPKVRKGRGEKGPLKVFRKLHAEEIGHASCDVDAAAEVAVNLNGIENNGDKHEAAAEIVGMIENPRHHEGGAIGDEELFKIAVEHEKKAPAKGEAIRFRPVKVLGNGVVTGDGPLHDLRKKGQIQGVF